jgi:3-hydroxy-5-methyl-1-naphthoate 3-O-methyltransferase
MTNQFDMDSTPNPHTLIQTFTGFQASKTLVAAHRLGLFSYLADGTGRTMNSIAEHYGWQHRPAEAFLTVCVSLGLLERKDQQYRNSPMADQFLVPERPYYLGGWIDFVDHREYRAWERLPEALATDRPLTWDPDAQTTVFSADDPGMVAGFWDGMHSISVSMAGALAAAHDFGNYQRLLDVGGGTAAFDITLCRRYPHLNATVYDLPFVCEMTTAKIAAADLSDRIAVRPGDFLSDQSLPVDHDAILLSWILHDWSESTGRMLLQKCYDALPHGGHVLINELLVNDDKTGPLDAALMGLTMIIETWGRNYTAAEYTDWLTDVGFIDMQIVAYRNPGSDCVIVACKP